MSSELETALWIVVGLTASYFIIPVIVVFQLQRFPLAAKMAPFERTAQVPADILDFLDDAGQQLTSLGFESLGAVALPNPAPHIKVFVEVWVNRRAGDSALVSCLYGVLNGRVTNRIQYTEFVRRLRQHELTLIQTSNANDVGAFPPEPNERTYRFPQVADLARLYRLHRQLVDRDAPGAQPVLRVCEEFADQPIPFLQDAVLCEGYRRQEERGWLRCDEAAQCWRPTTWGACRMTWQELWPFKSIRLQRMHRQARRQLAELEADGDRERA